jgi:hypothetical protein
VSKDKSEFAVLHQQMMVIPSAEGDSRIILVAVNRPAHYRS